MSDNGADRLVERGSTELHRLAGQAAGRGGVVARLAQPLEEDAQFLRKLQPSLVARRLRGEETAGARPAAGPQPRPQRDGKASGSASPLGLIAAAAATGLVLAKAIDWRGHAHPRA
jgi:hypothetical protein